MTCCQFWIAWIAGTASNVAGNAMPQPAPEMLIAHGADDQSKGCDDFKINQRLQRHASDAAELAMPGDARGDGRKNQGRHNHANEA